jgi:hypothetical protein
MWPFLKYCYSIFFVGLRKTTRILSRYLTFRSEFCALHEKLAYLLRNAGIEKHPRGTGKCTPGRP